jgi:GTP-binding protein EngB required for normal cell division
MLAASRRGVCMVFNKIDKVKGHEVDRKIARALEALDATSETAVVPFSTQSGAGRQVLWAWIGERLSG